MGDSLFYQVTGQEEMALSEGKFRLDNRKKILHRKGFQTLQEVAQQSGGATIPGGI